MSEADLVHLVLERIEGAVPARDVLMRAPVLMDLAARCVVLTDGELSADAVLVEALIRAASESMSALGQLDARRIAIVKEHSEIEAGKARAKFIREQLALLATDRAQLAGDIAATWRWLDIDALVNRMTASASVLVDQMQMAWSAAAELVRGMSEEQVLILDEQTALEVSFEHHHTGQHEAPRVEALHFATALLQRLAPNSRLMALGPGRLRDAMTAARDPNESAWVRVAALELAITAVPQDSLDLLTTELKDRDTRDGMVVRNNALRLLVRCPQSVEQRLEVAEIARDDPSEHVRQGATRCLAKLGGAAAARSLAEYCLDDSVERVRAYGLRELGRCAQDDLDAAREFQRAALRVLNEATEADGSTRETKLSVEVALMMIQKLCCGYDAVLVSRDFVTPLTALLSAEHLNGDLLEGAAALLVTLEVHANGELHQLQQTFADAIHNLDAYASDVVDVFPDTPLADVEKALLVASRGDLGISLQPIGSGRYRLTRGERRGIRLWRLLFELRTPAPDKRQAFMHTHARVPSGSIVVPPMRMGEVTPTRVPGERRWHETVKGWGEFLPLVDDLLAASRLLNRERRIVTGFGTLVVRGPANPLSRLWVWLRLTLRYERFARERGLALEARDPQDRRAFAERIRSMGFELDIRNATGTIGELDYAVSTALLPRYLGSASSSALPLWVESLVDEVVTPVGNTAWHLALFVWIVFCAVFVRGAWQRTRIEAARKTIPLNVGGWGSRGKSGTERIKTALFHAMRYDTVVKTTGCEAMLIHARRDLPAHELFVYRPYDKATIWEQDKVLHYGAKLGAQVFLWECMALRPQFVGILQQEWMRSPITTLTNAYPDHEDVMGPSGEDVARVIATFMPPEGGTVISAEDQMRPVLKDAARQRGATYVESNALEAELLPEDLLARYPYAEHPKNIAMVLALGEHFGIDHEWGMVKMADFVVADLGVLKTYPTVPYRRRTLTFSNGMSANERAGFMSNWTRLGFDKLDPDDDAETVIVTLVNNRADRVPRSRVFAELLMRDIVTDHTVIIGTNLAGMQRFIAESLESRLAGTNLGKGDNEEAHQLLEGLFREMRIPQRSETLARRVRCVMAAGGLDEDAITQIVHHPELVEAERHEGAELGKSLRELVSRSGEQEPGDDLGLEPQSVVEHVERLLSAYRRGRRAKAKVAEAIDAGDRARGEELMRACFRELLLERVHVVTDSHAKGDMVVDHIARAAPPGHHARVLGCQNIKGTGLDFAYRWVSVAAVFGALDKLENEPPARDEALRILSSHGDYGLVDCLYGAATLRRLREQGGDEWTQYTEQMAALEKQLSTLAAAKQKKLSGPAKQSLLAKFVAKLEPLVDHLDSIRRQNQATRIMNDVLAGRIAQGRAALLLREVVARGKGGWAAKGVEQWLAKRRKGQGEDE